MTIKNIIKNISSKSGYRIGRKTNQKNIMKFGEVDTKIINSVMPYTQTNPERIVALLESVNYVVKNEIPGSIVECGVGKGGSIMAAVKKLQSLQCSNRDIYLFDTFMGMTKPTDVDISYLETPALTQFEKLKIDDNSSNWSNVSIEEVKKVVYSTGYDKEKIHFVKGKVEDTLPSHSPNLISILRLDTDWYESTKHELIHLFPHLSSGGVLIIDDYGHWEGSKKAVDEYISQNNIPILLNRIDYTARIGVKITQN